MTNSKSIVFVNQSSGYLMIDIINAHLPHYDEIILLTGELKPRSNKLDDRVKVHYLKKYDRTSNFKRLLTWFGFFLKSFFLLKFKYAHAKIYFVSNPPFNTFSAYLLRNRSFSFLVFDIFPQSLSKIKFFGESSFLYKKWEAMNHKVFSKAVYVFSISKGMQNILSTYSSKQNLVYTSLWSDSLFLKPLPKQTNSFAIDEHIVNTLNCVYSGNMGVTHPVEIIPEIAKNISSNNVQFYMIGDGGKKQAIAALKRKYQLHNFKLLPYQPMDVFPLSLAATDVGFVTLEEASSDLSVPSKFFSLLSVGAVIVGICSKKSELAELIDTHEVGKVFEVNEVDAMCSFINNLQQNKDVLASFKEKSINASQVFTSENAKKLLFNHV